MKDLKNQAGGRSMKETSDVNMLTLDELEEVQGGRFSGTYRTEALQFLKEHMDGQTFEKIMSHKEEKKRPYVAAKIFLNQSDWEKYVWIEQHGSLEGFVG